MIHRQWFEPRLDGDGVSDRLDAPRPEPIVLLHEGLGSVSAWGRFPQVLADATGHRVLAYDRTGYGRSDPLPAPWPARFMHEAAVELADVMRSEGIERAILIGHSDGATIALLYPSQALTGAPSISGIVSLSAHVFVEPVNVEAIAALRQHYVGLDGLQSRLARHHRDADATFEAWSDVWVSDRFRPWAIDTELASVRCPVIAVQGDADVYGSRLQLDQVAAGVAGPVEVHEMPGVDHWPHREATDEVLDLIASFCQQLVSSHPWDDLGW